MAELNLEQIAKDLVDRAVSEGATAADVVVLEGEEFSTTLRLGKIEKLKEAASKGLSLRVFDGKRCASAFSSDFSQDSLRTLVARTIAMAHETSEDPASGLAESSLLGQHQGDLELYSSDISALGTEERIGFARRAEEAALEADPRIKNSEGSWFESSEGTRVYASSTGFVGSYRSSYCSVAVVPIAQANGGGMQRDYWYSVARSIAALDSPESVGRKAAERALRRLGARKVATSHVPVIFDPETASSLVSHIFAAVRGDAVYRNASFLTGKLGQQVGGENVTILDDGLRPGGFGSRPFDDEGIPSSATSVIERGVLKNYLLDAYSARKLNLKTTGNATRGLGGTPSVGPKNFYLTPGNDSPEEIIRSVKEGLYVTELIGFGVNVVTGDYSRGAAGMWIQNGELAYPVEEVTIAGNLRDMLNHIEMIGRDLTFRRVIVSPTLRVGGLTVAGT
ncbi:MAG: TldD/PmbA family protein [Acidobacteria bacterium]|nr:TldD/PmbA family protein [Acidobacteriota bacterium]